MADDSGLGRGRQFIKEHVVATLRSMGHHDAADKALRELPQEADAGELSTFCERHRIPFDKLFGGNSPRLSDIDSRQESEIEIEQDPNH